MVIKMKKINKKIWALTLAFTMLLSMNVVVCQVEADDLPPSITFVYDDMSKEITITSADSGYHYSDSSSGDDANLIFVRDNDNYTFYHYVGGNMSVVTSGAATTEEIYAGNVISGFSEGWWSIYWKPYGSGYSYMSFYVSESSGGGNPAPNITFVYDDSSKTITIGTVDEGLYYSDSSNSTDDANLVFIRNNDTFYHYVDNNMYITSSNPASTEEIESGDTISGFSEGWWSIYWKPYGSGYSYMSFYVSEESSSPPGITFSYDDSTKKVTVTSADPGLYYSDCSPTTCANLVFVRSGETFHRYVGDNMRLVTSELLSTKEIEAGDTISISQPGTYDIYWKSFGSGYSYLSFTVTYDGLPPSMSFSYDNARGHVTITSADSGYYYGDSTSWYDVNLVFVRDNDTFYHYVSDEMSVISSGYATTDGIFAGDVISDFSEGWWNIQWKPYGSGYSYYRFYVSEESSSTPSITYSYNSFKNTLTITSIDPGSYYSASLHPNDANLVFERNKFYNEEYVLSDLTVGTYEELSTKEIEAGDVISGFTVATYTMRWEPTGDEIGTFTVYSTEEGPQLEISVGAITEGSIFSVMITYEDPDSGKRPAKDTVVVFLGQEYQTNANGERDGWITLIAPRVEENTEYSISAIKDGYKSATKYFIVVDDSDVKFGWVYGTVLLRSGDTTIPANGAKMTVGVPMSGKASEPTSIGEEPEEYHEVYFVSSPVYTQTDENGEFAVFSLTIGTYIVDALHTKKYSSEQIIEVKEDEGTEVNFIIDISETRLEVEKNIKTGNIGGEIIILEEDNEYDHEILIYNGVEINPIKIDKNNISIIISGDENSTGKTIAITTALDMFDLTNDLVIKYDDELIKMADSISDVLNPNDDGIHAEYLITIGTDGIEILISIPHFSEHEITISTSQPEGPIDEIVESVGGINAIMLYLSICIVASVLFIGTIYMRRKL